MAAKTSKDYGHGVSHPGLTGVQRPSDMMFPPGSPFCFGASNPVARNAQTNKFQGIGDGFTYLISDWTVSIPNTADAVAHSTTGGVLITAGSDGAFCSSAESINLYAPGVGVKMMGYAILQTSDITTVGFDWGFGTHCVAPQTTDYTDGIILRMAVGAGTVTGRVRGGSGTVAATSTIVTAVAATDFFVGFHVDFGTLDSVTTTVTTGVSSATQTLASTAGIIAGDVLYFATTAVYAAVASVTNSTTLVLGTSISTTTSEVVTHYKLSGSFWAGANPQSATETPFSSAQLVQLAKMVRASASCYHCLTATGSAGNPTVLYKAAHLERDRV